MIFLKWVQDRLTKLNYHLYSLRDLIPTSWKKAAISLGLAGITTLTGIISGCTSSRPVTPPSITQPTTTPNPVEEYARSLGLSDTIISRLKPLGEDGVMDDNEKVFINYLFNLSKAEVVSSEVLGLAPSSYRDEVVKSLQTKVVDDIIKDGISQDEAKALTYLSTFPGKTQRDLIEFGLDNTTISFLTLNSSSQDQDFARYAVTNRLCIQNHELTDLEMEFLKNPSPENLEKVLRFYESELHSHQGIGSILLKEIQKLPEYKKNLATLEALEDITYMLKHATNPEVKEAFELMIKGGTPDPRDFRYKVPDWNTELQVLYQLALQNEFKQDDTLAQAIAMANGLWVTMGDDEVRQAVYKDVNDLLDFFRETNEIQKARGYYQLENYPLEAKVCLSWTGNQSPLMSCKHGLNLFVDKNGRFNRIFDRKSYEWNTLSIDTARQIRKIMDEKSWVDKDVEKVIGNIEKYFFFTNYRAPGNSDHWIYSRGTPYEGTIIVEGEKIPTAWFGNADFLFLYYLETGKGIGSCIDMATVADSWAKSWGISTTFVYRISEPYKQPNHTFISFYEPSSNQWKADNHELTFFAEKILDLYIFKPPILQKDYLKSNKYVIPFSDDTDLVRNYNAVYKLIKESMTMYDMRNFFKYEFQSSKMRDFLFYK